MPLQKLLNWMYYAEIEPFDEVREDLRAASICATIANCFRDPKKRSTPFVANDFVLKFGEDARPKQTWQDLKRIAQLYVAAYKSKEPEA